ncbi:GAF modulated Fis family sigma-54 specific transcriptional regulator [Calderihabitans maritimus]|uniref:GAF modulated Fis family sigma-54 specific transcriptional regulator n=2 Tax=Calderihabitans maritimus TaxID=1246530 RepID=A0A1Z5HNI1_9FIRM|nr:GAF modulated Fis family sigma-54 specific transcriptional regulator [Calderihabitans maritimus]
MQVDPMKPLSDLQLLGDQQIRKRVERRQELIDAAVPFMKHLYNFVKGSDTFVCLADDQGVILEALKDQVVSHRTKHLCYEVGADWSEAIAGTNAIGTALFEGKPIQVTASEHYCQVLHSLTGSAAPIFYPNGGLAGILCIMGLHQHVYPHTLGMVVAAVKAIENELAYRKTSKDLLVAYDKTKTVIETMSEGLISIEQNQIITHLNSEAAKILGVKKDNCIGKHAAEIFGPNFPLLDVLKTGEEYTDREILFDSPTGPVRFTSTARLIRDSSGNVRGMIATMRKPNIVHQLVNRFGGAQATFTFDDIIGNEPCIVSLIQKAKRVARSGSTILLQGESGTGKEMFAQAIHNASGRRYGPFVVINCGAIPRELVESELFGYEDGAFTGAKKGGRPGKFELANGGTIFLDEIGDMPLEIQAALLRVLQEKQITRIGGQKPVKVNTRVIAATNKNLAEEVDKGNFRLDLYYRLNVITLHIPPLRERANDIPRLTRYFVEKISRRLGIKAPKIDPEVFTYLQNYDWPGNVRELENVIEQALHVLEGEVFHHENLPQRILSGSGRKAFLRKKGLSKIKEVEAKLVKDTLEAHKWNITKAAEALGIGRNTLYRKIKQYNLAGEK